MTIPFETLRRKWMKDVKFRAEYERIGPAMELAFILTEAQRNSSEEESHDPGAEPP